MEAEYPGLEMLKRQHTRAGWELKGFKGFKEDIRSKVRSVQMDLAFPTFTNGHDEYEECLVTLKENAETLNKEWDIQTLTLVLRDKFQEIDPVNLGHIRFRGLLDLRHFRHRLINARDLRNLRPFDTCWGDLLNTWQNLFQGCVDPSSSFSSTLQRNLVINPRESTSTLRKDHLPTRMYLLVLGNLSDALADLHRVFSGILILDRRPIYENELVDKTPFVTGDIFYFCSPDMNCSDTRG